MMETLKSKSFSFSTSKFSPKRFSLPYFQSTNHKTTKEQPHQQQQQQQQAVVTKPPSTTAAINNDKENNTDHLPRAQKSKSLYITSLKKLTAAAAVATTTTPPQKKEYKQEEGEAFHPSSIRNSIKRSLSAILYTTPHQFSTKIMDEKEPQESGHHRLVPILVTPELSETLGDGILIDHQQYQQYQHGSCGCRDSASSSSSSSSSHDTTSEHTDHCLLTKKSEKISTEYDNNLNIISARDADKNDLTIIWQGYGFHLQQQPDNKEMTPAYIKLHYEKEVWESYTGLVHPLHVFHEELWNSSSEQVDIWSNLTVKEMKRYYDNYGSLLLKLHKSRMQQHQQQVCLI